MRNVLAEETKRTRLESDPQCGLTTGGRDECWWDCKIERLQHQTYPEEIRIFITNPTCLDDCYPPDHCLSHLLQDYKAAGGICKGGFLDTYYNAIGIWNISETDCEFHEEDDYYSAYDIKTGLCSEKTEMLLLDLKNCIHPLYSQKLEILNTIDDLIDSL